MSHCFTLAELARLPNDILVHLMGVIGSFPLPLTDDQRLDVWAGRVAVRQTPADNIERPVPASRLVGVETNPGPTSPAERAAEERTRRARQLLADIRALPAAVPKRAKKIAIAERLVAQAEENVLAVWMAEYRAKPVSQQDAATNALLDANVPNWRVGDFRP